MKLFKHIFKMQLTAIIADIFFTSGLPLSFVFLDTSVAGRETENLMLCFASLVTLLYHSTHTSVQLTLALHIRLKATEPTNPQFCHKSSAM
jgi:hypothetical protein